MSKVPTVSRPLGSPKDSFDNILNAIISTDPSKREAIIKPHLLSFIAHPIIKEILGQSEAPAPVESSYPQTLELKQIQDTLSSLSKAVDRLSKGNPPTKNPPPRSSQKAKGWGKHQATPTLLLGSSRVQATQPQPCGGSGTLESPSRGPAPAGAYLRDP